MNNKNQIIIEGVTIDLDTNPDDLIATGKFREHESVYMRSLVAKEWIDAFGAKFSGRFQFDPNYVCIKLYPKLDVESPGYPDPDYEKASWNFCKSVIENNFNNVEYNENKVSSTFSEGKISTNLIGDRGKNEFSGGYISIVFRGSENV